MMPGSPKKAEAELHLEPPNRTVMDAFNNTSWFTKEAEVGFGTGSRPPLMNPTAGPGPGAYQIKTTLGKVVESNIKSPCQFTLRGRTKFGDPNEKALSKSSANLPGPGSYDLTNKFIGGTNPRKSSFPKGSFIRDKSQLGPGPGSYQPLQSMGKQVLSTKDSSTGLVFDAAERPSLVPPGSTDVGPGEYSPPRAACEDQIDSRRRTCATIKFGTGYRAGQHKDAPNFSEPSPGPGSYRLPGGIATKAKGSPFRDSPTAVLSGRNKFGSPW